MELVPVLASRRYMPVWPILDHNANKHRNKLGRQREKEREERWGARGDTSNGHWREQRPSKGQRWPPEGHGGLWGSTFFVRISNREKGRGSILEGRNSGEEGTPVTFEHPLRHFSLPLVPFLPLFLYLSIRGANRGCRIP